MMNQSRAVFDAIEGELQAARELYPRSTASAHEGFAVMKEEVDELWEYVRLKQSDPTRRLKMRREAIQVAAMAVRFIEEVCDDTVE